ncbi:TRAF-type zinc finger domain-containing protein 1 [Nematostella vectensis]|uniref:TRAF-type zinc finger domain-containing protein 1 n=1 Tax=Nematostella vectensis TaxID=45351 RepID=UPI0020779632|nr:TRAF-type zinc finger domain-containing protein 1 [Nematostella vectensis]
MDVTANEEGDSTKYCSNCKRDIPGVNFVMHVNHCHRNITLCKICNEPFPTSQREDHFEEYHAKVKCQCGKHVEKADLAEHKENTCSSRVVTCDYCELELPFSKMKSHKDYCGARTELCEKCNKYITVKDMDIHISSDCDDVLSGANNTIKKVNPGNRHPDILRNFEDLAEDVDVLANGLGAYSTGNLFGDRSLPYDLHPFPEDLENKMNNVSARGNFDGRNNWYNEIADDSTDNAEDDQLMAAIIASQLQHIEDNTDRLFGGSRDPLPGISPAYVDDDIAPGLNGTVLPCEFCEVLFPAADLIQHQSGCQPLNNEVSDSMHSRYPAVHSQEPASTTSPFPTLRSMPRSLPPVTGTQQADKGFDNKINNAANDNDMLPCEFCKQLFPLDDLILHQSGCDPDQSRPPSIPPEALAAASKPLNNTSRPRRRNRPGRPSRPVVSDEREDWAPGWSTKKDRRELETDVVVGAHHSQPEINEERLTGFDLMRGIHHTTSKTSTDVMDEEALNNIFSEFKQDRQVSTDASTIDHSLQPDVQSSTNPISEFQPHGARPRIAMSMNTREGSQRPVPGTERSRKARPSKPRDRGTSSTSNSQQRTEQSGQRKTTNRQEERSLFSSEYDLPFSSESPIIPKSNIKGSARRPKQNAGRPKSDTSSVLNGKPRSRPELGGENLVKISSTSLDTLSKSRQKVMYAHEPPKRVTPVVEGRSSKGDDSPGRPSGKGRPLNNGGSRERPGADQRGQVAQQNLNELSRPSQNRRTGATKNNSRKKIV